MRLNHRNSLPASSNFQIIKRGEVQAAGASVEVVKRADSLHELEPADSSISTLCLGIDVTWWGGSTNKKESQRDTIVYALLNKGTASQLGISPLDLSPAPNPLAKQATEPNFDADGRLLVDHIKKIIDDKQGHFRRCVICLDAPLEAAFRSDQPPRASAHFYDDLAKYTALRPPARPVTTSTLS